MGVCFIDNFALYLKNMNPSFINNINYMMKHKFKSTIILGLALGLTFLQSQAQNSFNGIVNIGPSETITVFGDLTIGADAQVFFSRWVNPKYAGSKYYY
jgi:hypothetical protein